MAKHFFDTAAEALAYLTDCQIATFEACQERKSTSKSDKKRHEAIAREALAQCGRFHPDPAVWGKLRDRFERALLIKP